MLNPALAVMTAAWVSKFFYQMYEASHEGLTREDKIDPVLVKKRRRHTRFVVLVLIPLWLLFCLAVMIGIICLILAYIVYPLMIYSASHPPSYN